MKKSILITAAIAIVAMAIYAADNTGITSGVVRSVETLRWQTYRAATTATSLTSVTNVVTTQPGVLKQIVITPGSTNDSVTVYTAKVVTGATAASELFVYKPINSTVGLPVVFNVFGDATNGIATVIVPGDTTSVVRAFIQYDQNK